MNYFSGAKRVAVHTPWGLSQDREEVFPGAEFISTAGHGGLYLSCEVNSQIPAWLQKLTFNQQGRSGWYEEDCDWCIPVIIFSRKFIRWSKNKRLATKGQNFIDDAYRSFNTYHLPKIMETMVPGYRDPEPSKLKEGLYLGLYHGRDSIDKDMNDWGKPGPLIGPLKSFTVTYVTNIRLAFEDHLDALKYGFKLDEAELTIKEDCIEYRDIFYSDWQVYYHKP